jgi:hypothetical protein
MCKNFNFPMEKHGLSKEQGFEIEAILVDNPRLGRQVEEQGATSKNFPRILGKPGCDVSGVGRPRGTVHRVPPPLVRAVRGSPWSHTTSKIPIPYVFVSRAESLLLLTPIGLASPRLMYFERRILRPPRLRFPAAYRGRN